jgi:hypothetical protein
MWQGRRQESPDRDRRSGRIFQDQFALTSLRTSKERREENHAERRRERPGSDRDAQARTDPETGSGRFIERGRYRRRAVDAATEAARSVAAAIAGSAKGDLTGGGWRRRWIAACAGIRRRGRGRCREGRGA